MVNFLEAIEFKISYHYHEGFDIPIIGGLFWFFIFFPLVNVLYLTWFLISFPGLIIVSLMEKVSIVVPTEAPGHRYAINTLAFIFGFLVWAVIFILIRLFN